MIGILDYGIGNLQSVFNAFEFIGEKTFFIRTAEDLKRARAIVIPGVGHFKKGISGIVEAGLLDELNICVKEKKIPCLGICLGMQLMADIGFEGGQARGLGWVPAVVERIDKGVKDFNLRIPHVGWNDIRIEKPDSVLFKGMSRPTFYFVHSYVVDFKRESDRTGYSTSYVDYGRKITASFEHENICAVQFHPEKSQNDGIKLLRNFVEFAKDA